MFGTRLQKKLKVKRQCSREEFASMLRELADCLDGKKTIMTLDGDQFAIPSNAKMDVEHEREKDEEEFELKVKWSIL